VSFYANPMLDELQHAWAKLSFSSCVNSWFACQHHNLNEVQICDSRRKQIFHMYLGRVHTTPEKFENWVSLWKRIKYFPCNRRNKAAFSNFSGVVSQRSLGLWEISSISFFFTELKCMTFNCYFLGFLVSSSWQESLEDTDWLLTSWIINDFKNTSKMFQ